VARKGFGDDTWRLAVAGDVPALEQAAALLRLGSDEDFGYDGHRALAFARAVEGQVGEALAELNAGWTRDWPFPSGYAADIARVRYLGGDYRQALDALRLAARSADVLDPAVPELAAACVARAPATWPRALLVALAGGSAAQRLHAVGLVLRARF
jgi:hypothetical protein